MSLLSVITQQQWLLIEKQSELLGGAGDALDGADPYLSQTVLDLQFAAAIWFASWGGNKFIAITFIPFYSINYQVLTISKP